jgi:hypothetical protein
MKAIVPLAAVGLLFSPAAFAQPASHPAPQPAPATAASGTANSGVADSGGIQQRMQSDLQKAGFTDVKVMPDSFLINAKDRSGQPVAMIVSPTSMTAIVDQSSAAPGANQPQAGANSAIASNTSSDPAGAGPMFTTVPANDRLSSEVVGLDVYNKANQDIGTIKDIAYTGGRVKAYIVAVGGFLGMGDRYVAVDPSDMKVSYDTTTKKWHANMDTTADQLKSAPAFTYSAKA